MKSRRVLYLSPLPPPAGGIATWTRILRERGLPGNWVAEFLDTRSEVPSFSTLKSRLNLNQFRRWRRILSELRKRLKCDSPDLVHINCSPYPIGMIRDTLCALLAVRYRIPYVVHFRGDVTKNGVENQSRTYRYLLHKLTALSSLSIVLNQRSKDYLQQISPEVARVEKICNFFDDQSIKIDAPARLTVNQTPRVVFIGGLTRAKGAHVVIDVAARLPEIEFILIGAVYSELESTLAGATPNVESTGEVSHGETVARLSKCHAFILPTHHMEGFPNVVCEAMASALPVVARPAGAISEMIDDGHGGILLKNREISTVVEALRDVFQDEERRLEMGRYNLEKARQEYTYQNVCGKLIRLYDRVLDS